jgi:Uma2 family endonuclease
MESNSHKKVKDPSASYDGEYTYTDYLKFEYEHMVEIIRGKIFKMTPAPTSWHQMISAELFGQLYIHFKSKSCSVFSAPFDVILPIKNQQKNTSTTVVQPDISVICDHNKIEEEGCVGPPDLIVEILSPSTSKKDLNNKYSIYEESGVKEYWIVMPKERLVEVFFLVNGKYQRIKTYTEKETIKLLLFPELKIDLKEIFKDIPE